MTTKVNLINSRTLGLCRVAIANAEKHNRISKALEDIGYGAETLNEGKKLLEETRKVFISSVDEKHYLKSSSVAFAKRKAELSEMYELQREKTRLLYLERDETADLLGVLGNIPHQYDRLIETVRKYYTAALADQGIQDELSRMKITQDDLNAGLAKIEEVEVAREEYMFHKGESQDLTKAKNEAFEKLHNWMKSFYHAAKVSVKGRTQLLESLGKIVKG